jgi:aryl-alcohol dehydrogenase-like predicted oxidoreductase
MAGTQQASTGPCVPTTRASETGRIVLGGRFGEEPATLSWQRLDHFVASGGRFVDTAHCYADGGSERVIGQWLRTHPGAVAVIDKIGHPGHDDRLDLSRDRLRREVAESARRLGVGAINVVMLHRDAPGTPVTELAGTLAQLAEDGYARRIGVSNWSAARLDELAGTLTDLGHVPLVSYQRSLAVPAAPLWPGTFHADAALREVISSRGLTLLAWAAQARGYFAGTTELPIPGQADPFDTATNRGRRQRCRILADDLGVRPETVALAWLLHHRDTWPIVGPRSMAELDASLVAARLQFDCATLRWLAEGIR